MKEHCAHRCGADACETACLLDQGGERRKCTGCDGTGRRGKARCWLCSGVGWSVWFNATATRYNVPGARLADGAPVDASAGAASTSEVPRN